jgi:glucose-6-phosphate dehydrogenase assembly protein OpcA
MQIQLEKTLDVEAVERQLAELWKRTGGERDADNDVAVLRARVANLLVFVAGDAALAEVQEMLGELTAIHPSRVLIMRADGAAEDRDIEMTVNSFCQTDKRTGAQRLCCEEVALKAGGKFVAELPSVALPLLVPDLSTFLWWQNSLRVSNKVFDTLMRATDRLVIDSAEFDDPARDLLEINKLYTQDQSSEVGISDLNWARLTLWRGLLADFYDVPAYQVWLDRVNFVGIDYVGPELAPETVAPQALLIAGWLASRLGWTPADEQSLHENDDTISLNFYAGEGGSSPTVKGDKVRTGSGSDRVMTRGSSPTPGSPAEHLGWGGTVRKGVADQTIKLELKRVETAEHKPGRLVQVELRSTGADGEEPTSFVVTRSEDNLHVLSEAKLGANTHRGRVLPVRNRSAAHLLSREMEILCNDQIYQEALAVAAEMMARLSESPID